MFSETSVFYRFSDRPSSKTHERVFVCSCVVFERVFLLSGRRGYTAERVHLSGRLLGDRRG